MKLREIIDSPCGLRYMIETLPLSSGYAMSYLMDKELYATQEEIENGYLQLGKYLPLWENFNSRYLSSLQHKLFTLKDITRTILRVEQGDPVDDIELFEIKHCLILTLDAAELLGKSGIEDCDFDVANVEKVLSILDPDGHRIDAFYIYDSYSEELSRLRKQIAVTDDADKLSELKFYEHEIEKSVRETLCKKLSPWASLLRDCLCRLVNIDIDVAKGGQMKSMNLIVPEIASDGCGIYKGMFHPYVQSILDKSGAVFTPIDIELDSRPALIIGANMGGKTVVLKMLAMAQYLMGMSMGIPAEFAAIPLKKRIFFISGDAQNLSSGLSSFAAEIKSIDQVIVASEESPEDIIAMIDEPARSTNPVEGTALVLSLINVLKKRGVSLVMTTHYNIRSEECLKYRVSGLENGKMNYRLCKTSDNEVPREALAVAQSLNISAEWIAEAKKLLTV
ncbi:MAG: hypothetical protein J6U51_07185 [Bacteroidales bacterium]|nr:hypothetical protein [Bacteroidales bacterium]